MVVVLTALGLSALFVEGISLCFSKKVYERRIGGVLILVSTVAFIVAFKQFSSI